MLAAVSKTTSDRPGLPGSKVRSISGGLSYLLGAYSEKALDFVRNNRQSDSIVVVA